MEISHSEENLRVISLKTGNKIKIIRTDPYGLWHIALEKGPIPKELEGTFTRADLAIRHVDNFIRGSKYFEVGTPEDIPTLETKEVSKAAAAKAAKLKEQDVAKREASGS